MYDDETCSESRKTVTRVDQCPQNLSSWIEREKVKNCASIAHTCSRPLVYHCVINPWLDEMIEVCAPRTKINAGKFLILSNGTVDTFLTYKGEHI